MIQETRPPPCMIPIGTELPQGRKNPVSVHVGSLWSCLTLQPCGLWPARLLCPWDFPGRNAGVGCHTLYGTIFPTALATSSPEYLMLPECCDSNSCATSTPGPHWGRPKSPGQTQEQTPVNNSYAEWPRKRTQNLLTSYTSCRLNPQDQLGRLCVYGI